MNLYLRTVLVAITLVIIPSGFITRGETLKAGQLHYIDTAFENASPLYWEADSSGVIFIHLLYDQERDAINRQNTHWHFRIVADAGTELTLVLTNFDNIWNGRKSSALTEKTTCYLSSDGVQWRAVIGEKTPENWLKLRIKMERESLYVARVEPYRLSDLEKFKNEIAASPLIQIESIGKTVEGRDLEMIRVGSEKAPFRVLLRARAHPWESGGNWVVEGLIRGLLRPDEDNRRYLHTYCVYVMPMAGKDGVVRGRTRFNSSGMDLNRKWDQPADSLLSPENFALEKWLERKAALGLKPHLAIDFHNDESGRIHISRPPVNLEDYLVKMERFESLLREFTWFTEGSTGADYRNPGTLGEGLLERFGIAAIIYELNANWIAGLQKVPASSDWISLGDSLRQVFYRYFTAE